MKTSNDPLQNRTFFHGLLESFDGLREGSRGRTMRVIYCLLVGAAIGAYLRGISLRNWVILMFAAGVFLALEHRNNGDERQEDRFNRLAQDVERTLHEAGLSFPAWPVWNGDTRHIKHQSSAAVLVSGIFGLAIYVIIMVYNP